jgi:hypothetical protein
MKHVGRVVVAMDDSLSILCNSTTDLEPQYYQGKLTPCHHACQRCTQQCLSACVLNVRQWDPR